MLLSESQKMIQEMARNVARDVLQPEVALRDRERRFPKAELKALADLGLLGMLVPEEHGGSGVGYMGLVLAIAEVAAVDGAISTIMSVQNSLVSTAVLRYGNAAQKAKFLPELASGRMIGAFALTEPQAGSDAAEIRTRAEKRGNHYVLNGSKQFITSGKHGDLAIVFAVTKPALGKKGMSAFLVPTSSKGYVVTKLEEKMGQHASDTAQLAFEDLEVPEEMRLGAEGEGYAIALSNLEGGRLGIAAQSVGLARGALREATRYAAERTAFGKPIREHQAVAFKLADMAARVAAAEQLLWHAAALKEAGEPCLKEACMAKLVASETAEQVASDAVHVHGGYGYLSDFAVERIYRDAKVCSIYEGTSEIQRLIIAREMQKEQA